MLWKKTWKHACWYHFLSIIYHFALLTIMTMYIEECDRYRDLVMVKPFYSWFSAELIYHVNIRRVWNIGRSEYFSMGSFIFVRIKIEHIIQVFIPLATFLMRNVIYVMKTCLVISFCINYIPCCTFNFYYHDYRYITISKCVTGTGDR